MKRSELKGIIKERLDLQIKSLRDEATSGQLEKRYKQHLADAERFVDELKNSDNVDHLFELKKSTYKFDIFAGSENKKTKSVTLTGDWKSLQNQLQKIADKDGKLYTAYVGNNKWDEFEPRKKR